MRASNLCSSKVTELRNTVGGMLYVAPLKCLILTAQTLKPHGNRRKLGAVTSKILTLYLFTPPIFDPLNSMPPYWCTDIGRSSNPWIWLVRALPPGRTIPIVAALFSWQYFLWVRRTHDCLTSGSIFIQLTYVLSEILITTSSMSSLVSIMQELRNHM